MAKKHFKALVALAAVAGAAAAGVSYFLRYKSFNKELEEEFHGFEDESMDSQTDDSQSEPAQRTYVTLSKDKDDTQEFDGYEEYMVPKKPADEKNYPEDAEFPDENFIEDVHHGETEQPKNCEDDYNCTYMQDCKIKENENEKSATTITEDTAE